MNIYVFGNPLVPEDSLAVKLIPDLQKRFPKTKFIHADPNENFPPEDEKDLIILDTIKGVKKTTVFNLDDIAVNNKSPISPHDYDLGIHLLLLKKMKKINYAVIIGVPTNMKQGNINDIYRCIDISISK